jgi:hypothetical protein
MEPLSMNDVTSDCVQHFGHEDFDLSRVRSDQVQACPVKTCSAPLLEIDYRKGKRAFCATHGLRLHANTFVYWNGTAQRDTARLRNFRIRPDLAQQIALDPKSKAETHRLGYEMSEDALSWNVFVGLAGASKLRESVQFLTGRGVPSEPQLYLWGERINLEGNRGPRFNPLDVVRGRLEGGIGKYKTELDIMLVVDGQLVVCVEAKFGSGNPVAHESNVKADQKPTSREGLLERYFANSSAKTKAIISTGEIGKAFHSQLFRNVVFASEMAQNADWHVVNLASSTQWKPGREAKGYSFSDPEESVRCYLSKSHRDCFSYRTWENLHAALIRDDPALRELDTYLRSKSAHFRPAFELA